MTWFSRCHFSSAPKNTFAVLPSVILLLLLCSCNQAILQVCPQNTAYHYSAFKCRSDFKFSGFQHEVDSIENATVFTEELYDQLPYFQTCTDRKSLTWKDRTEKLLRRQVSRLVANLRNVDFFSNWAGFKSSDEDLRRKRDRRFRSPLFEPPTLQIDPRQRYPVVSDIHAGYPFLKFSLSFFEQVCKDFVIENFNFVFENIRQRNHEKMLEIVEHSQRHVFPQDWAKVTQKEREEYATFIYILETIAGMITHNFNFEAAVLWVMGHELYHLTYPIPPNASCEEKKKDEIIADRIGIWAIEPILRKRHYAREIIKRNTDPDTKTLNINEEYFYLFIFKALANSSPGYRLFLGYVDQGEIHGECYPSAEERVDHLDQFIEREFAKAMKGASQ